MWNKRPYQKVSESHRTGEKGWEYCLCIRINGRRFFIHLSESNFENSPSRLEEASKRMALFYDDDEDEEDEDGYDTLKTDEEKKAQDEAHFARVEITNRFDDWVVKPFLEVFVPLAPPPLTGITALTMAHVYHQDSFECELGAVDDELVPGAVTKRESVVQEVEVWDDDEEQVCPLPPTTLPVFRLDQVDIRSRWWERTRDMQQMDDGEYSVGGRDLCLLWPPFPVREKAGHLIRMHEAVASASLGPEVRIQSLFGIVVDDAGNVFRLLTEPIPQGSRMWYYRSSERPVAVRERWARQVEAAVEALHGLGFLWGRPHHDSVAVDEDDNAWLVEFDPVPDPGFLDEDSPSRERDLKGIAELRKGLGLSIEGRFKDAHSESSKL